MGKLNNFMNNNQGLVGSVGSAIDSFQTMGENMNEEEQRQFQSRKMFSDAAIKSRNPIAMAIGVGSKIVDVIGTKTGLNLSAIDKKAAKKAGVKGAGTFNNVMNYLPGNSMLWGMYVGKTKQADEISQNILNTQDAFSGTIGDLNSAKQLGGKRMMFGKKKANKFIEKQNKKNEYLDNLITTNTYSKQSDYATDLSQQNVNKTQGASFMNNSIGKNGMKLMPLNVAKQKLLLNNIYKQRLVNNNQEVERYENGGSFSIIPEGARHSRLNHINELNPAFEDLTRKGIPVIYKDENGVVQTAEIERGEIIFSKEITDKIEELRKIDTDESAIDAGKILSEEIITNTEDKTGELLVDKFANGGQFEFDNKEKVEISINDEDYDVLVFRTEEEKEIGLQNVESMDDDEGGIFVYDKPQHVDFWMKDTSIPLDIIFVDENNTVISVKQGEPNSEEYISEDNVKYVIELNANSGIKSGDKVVFEDYTEIINGLDVNKMYVIGEDGKPQMELFGGERIFSIPSTKIIIKKAKKAYKEKTDSAYRSLGKYVFKEMNAQDSRGKEYVKE